MVDTVLKSLPLDKVSEAEIVAMVADAEECLVQRGKALLSVKSVNR